ncbi:MAG: Na+/H+ antiporter subunit E [Alkalilacustris sp.]
MTRAPLPDPARAARPSPADAASPSPRSGSRGGRFRPGRAAGAGIAGAFIWTAMTGPAHWADPAGWIIGAVAVAAVAALSGSAPVRAVPAAPRHRVSPVGALRLSGWFAAQALRGAVDVAGRALSPGLPVAPGWYRHPLRLPPGAPRLVMANAITLLPGTLTAEMIEGAGDDHLILHLLDARTDPAPDLEALEARVCGLFGLPAPMPCPLPAPVTADASAAALQRALDGQPAPLALPRPGRTPDPEETP